MKNPEFRWLNRDIHTLVLHYCLCIDEDTFYSEIKRLGVKERPEFMRSPTSHATVHFLENRHNQSKVAIVCIRDWQGKSPAQITGLLTHEAAHIFDEHCDLIGERDPSSEFKAYAMQNITQCLLHSFLQQTMPLKKKRKRNGK